jgi:hypothetical protein
MAMAAFDTRAALPLLLSLNAGFVDTAGFLALQGLFTAHVTGNFVTLGASLVLGTSGAIAGSTTIGDATNYYINGAHSFRNESSVTTYATINPTGVTSNNSVIATTSLKNGVTTVGGLPTCNAGAEGTRYGVKDATAGSAVFGTVLVGGSTVHTSAYCNGTSWVGG